MSNVPIAQRLREHFQGWADRLASELRSSRALGHAGDIGEKNEVALMGFIESHLPARCRVSRGGYIFGVAQENYDSPGNLVASKQIDLIVTNDLTLQFGDTMKSFSSIEGCYASITVKTMLDKTQLEEALLNIASIPESLPWNVELDSTLSRTTKAVFFDLPFSCLFSYDGISSETLIAHIEQFYQNHTKIPISRRPNLIIANNKYCLYRADPWREDNQSSIPQSGYRLVVGKNIGGRSLFDLMRGIQGAANYAAHVRFGFSQYAGRIPWND